MHATYYIETSSVQVANPKPTNGFLNSGVQGEGYFEKRGTIAALNQEHKGRRKETEQEVSPVATQHKNHTKLSSDISKKTSLFFFQNPPPTPPPLSDHRTTGVKDADGRVPSVVAHMLLGFPDGRQYESKMGVG
jgi:histone deacetylase complex regulatory component SIN3